MILAAAASATNDPYEFILIPNSRMTVSTRPDRRLD